MIMDHVQTYPVVSETPAVQARYEGMRAAGQSHNMAEVLALRAFPATRTDVEFNRGRVNGSQFEATPAQGDYYRAIANRAGVSTVGKQYMASLADFPGDPTAWVSGRGDVLRVAEAKGYKVSGAVEYDPGEREPMADQPIDPTLVDKLVDDVMALDGGERRADVRERVYGCLTGGTGDGELLVGEPTCDSF